MVIVREEEYLAQTARREPLESLPLNLAPSQFLAQTKETNTAKKILAGSTQGKVLG